MKYQREISELRERLDALEKRLWRRWQPEDIVSGIIVDAPHNSRCVVIQRGYGSFDEPTLYFLGGLDNNPLRPFSGCARTAQEMADYFNQSEHRQVGTLTTNFNDV